MRSVRTILMLMVVMALAIPAFAASEEARKPYELTGEVVAVKAAVANAGELPMLQIRTQERTMVMLQLGPADDAAANFQAGDQIRARVMASQGKAGVVEAIQIQNKNTNKMLRVRTEDGKLIRQQTKQQDGQGEEVRTREQHRTNIQGAGGSQGGGGSRTGGGRR